MLHIDDFTFIAHGQKSNLDIFKARINVHVTPPYMSQSRNITQQSSLAAHLEHIKVHSLARENARAQGPVARQSTRQ